MDALKYGVVVLLCIVCVFPSVVAVTAQAISMTQCNLSTGSSSVACGTNVTASCLVVSTLAGSPLPVVNSVEFVLQNNETNGGVQSFIYSIPAPTSGSRTNGTWAVTFPVTFQGTLRFKEVTAYSSSGVTCSADRDNPSEYPNNQYAYCYIAFYSPADLGSACSCGLVASYGACRSDDTAIATWTNPCDSSVAFTSVAACDFCDPKWYLSTIDCQTNKSSSDPMSGTGIAHYLKGNASCTSAADNIPPVGDGKSISCRLDYWSTLGKGGQNQVLQNEVTSSVFTSSVAVSRRITNTVTGGSFAYGDDNVTMRPLVFDVEGDGTTDIIAFRDNGFTVYDQDLGVPIYDMSVAREYWEGQPSLWGFTTYTENIEQTGRNYLLEGGYVVGDNGIGFAGIMYENSSGNDYFVSYRYENGSWVQKAMVDLFVTYGESAYTSGVMCYLDTCYFLTSGNHLYGMNASTGAKTFDVNVNAPTAVSTTDVIGSVPALVSFGGLPSAIVVEGVAKVGIEFIPAVFACPLSGGACSNVKLTGTNVSDGGISNVVVSGADGSTVHIAFTSSEWLNGERVFRLWNSYLSSSLSFSQFDAETLEGVGGAAECISNIASTQCMSGGSFDGVAVAEKFSPESVVSIGYPSMPIRYQHTVNLSVSNPYISGQVTQGDCFGKYCIMMDTSVATRSLYLLDIDADTSTLISPMPVTNYTFGIGHLKENFVFVEVVGTANPRFVVWRLDPVSKVFTLVSNASYSSDLSTSGTIQVSHGAGGCTDTGCSFSPFSATDWSLSSMKYGLYIDENWGVTMGKLPGSSLVFGQNLSDNTCSVHGYVKTSVGRYFNAYCGAGAPGSKYYLVREDIATGIITVLDNSVSGGDIYGAAEAMIGPIRESNSDAVYWLYRHAYASTDLFSTYFLNLSYPAEVYFSGSNDLSGYSSVYSTTVHSYVDRLKRYPGGLSGGTYQLDFDIVGITDSGLVVALGATGLFGGGIIDGKRVVAYQIGGGGAPLYATTVVFAEGSGVYIPYALNNVSSSATAQLCENTGDSDDCQVYVDGTTSVNYRFLSGMGFTWSGSYEPRLRIVGSQLKVDLIGDVTTTTTNVDYTEYACYSYEVGLGWQKKWSYVGSPVCETNIVAADMDGDGQREIVSSNGVFGPYYKKTNVSSIVGAAVVVADITSDRYSDIVLVTPALLRTIVSNPDRGAVGQGELTLDGCTARFDAASNTISVSPYGLLSPHPAYTQYNSAISVGGSSAYTGWKSAPGVFEITSTNTYNISLMVRDSLYSDVTKSATCPVYAEYNVTQIVPSACTLDPRGEFNFMGALTNQGWEVTSYGATLSADGAEAVASGSGYAFASTSLDKCRNSSLGVLMKVNLSQASASNYGAVTVYAGTQNPMASIKFVRTQNVVDVYVFRDVGTSQKIFSSNSSSVLLKVVMDRVAGTQSVYIGDVSENATLIISLPLMNTLPLSEAFNAVGLTAFNGMRVDYIRLVAAGGVEVELNDAVQRLKDQYLVDCVRYSKTYDPKHNASVYQHVSSYCEARSDLGVYTISKMFSSGVEDVSVRVCTGNDLVEVVRYNPECYEEAYSYCVEEMFPIRGDELGSPTNQVSSTTSYVGLAGATVCSGILGGGYGASVVAFPLIGFVWKYMILANILWILLIVMAVLVVVVATRRR